MNHLIKSQTAGAQWAGLFLALLFLPPVFGESIVSPILGVMDAWPSHARHVSPVYLEVVGPPSLRFEEPPPKIAPQTDVSAHPAAVPPPLPALDQGASQSSILEVLLAPGWFPSHGSRLKLAPKAPSGPAVAPDSPPILPDDESAGIHPEDFLPFFQFPAGTRPGGGDASVAPPAAPGRLPPGTGTYSQE